MKFLDRLLLLCLCRSTRNIDIRIDLSSVRSGRLWRGLVGNDEDKGRQADDCTVDHRYHAIFVGPCASRDIYIMSLKGSF